MFKVEIIKCMIIDDVLKVRTLSKRMKMQHQHHSDSRAAGGASGNDSDASNVPFVRKSRNVPTAQRYFAL